MSDSLLTLIMLGIAGGTVALTISKAEVFAFFRAWVDRRTDAAFEAKHLKRVKAWMFFGELVNCPYCMSHWAAFVATAVYQPRPVVSQWYWVDMVSSAFLMTAFAAVASGFMLSLFTGGEGEH